MDLALGYPYAHADHSLSAAVSLSLSCLLHIQACSPLHFFVCPKRSLHACLLAPLVELTRLHCHWKFPHPTLQNEITSLAIKAMQLFPSCTHPYLLSPFYYLLSTLCPFYHAQFIFTTLYLLPFATSNTLYPLCIILYSPFTALCFPLTALCFLLYLLISCPSFLLSLPNYSLLLSLWLSLLQVSSPKFCSKPTPAYLTSYIHVLFCITIPLGTCKKS